MLISLLIGLLCIVVMFLVRGWMLADEGAQQWAAKYREASDQLDKAEDLIDELRAERDSLDERVDELEATIDKIACLTIRDAEEDGANDDV